MKSFVKSMLISYVICMLFAGNWNFMEWTQDERMWCAIFGLFLFVMED